MTDTVTETDAARTYRLDRAHVFHSWSAQARFAPMVVTRAEGSRVWDGDGREYLDFSSQLVFTNIGHQHPKVVAAVQRQAAQLCTIAPGTAVAPRSEAARLVAELAPEGMDKVFFTNGGADANEHAIRMARLHTGRVKVLSTYRSYHGGTHLAVNVTGDPRRWASDHGSAGTVHFFGPFLYRSPFHATTEAEECQRALEHLEQVIALEGPDTIAAIILESIPGTAGIMPPPPGYLAGVRELASRHGIVYIADEVMTGFGRTGTWWGLEHGDVVPDLITFAKGVNSGYVPLGGVVLNGPIAATFDDRVYPGGLTYSGHPLACAAAVATIETMHEERIVENAARLGREVLGPVLAELARTHPSVGEVRGTGVFWAVELVRDRASREPLAPYGGTSEVMNATVAACKAEGLLPFVNYNRIHVVPPLTISDQDARRGLEILDHALTVADAATTG
ncbi:MAG TPA: aspartate aminotransferase family protein [Nocardioides sp.]|uniref:aspartate aminotransferase family protein n=1 Tax=Nocardioides sp. TaxID=35761 RepID=UPI002CA24799|nr:aspartate aminotransferase family protein [Nocardioides sp.]HQR26222.1 aspartate aminotransferase family protein [Nocardioides sp.]